MNNMAKNWNMSVLLKKNHGREYQKKTGNQF